MALLDARTLGASADPYSGTVTFPVRLAEVAAPGMVQAVELRYSSDVVREACTWNLDAPAGVVGLGWTLPLSLVARLPGDAVTPAEARYVLRLGDVVTPLVRTGTAADGRLEYHAERHAFWRIFYAPARETWTVLTDDGETYELGDSHAGRGSVGWRVAWGGWSGASGRLQGQRRFADRWYLARRRNLFAQGFTFTYQAVEVPVGADGGLAYTQATYLTAIEGTGGDRLVLEYAQKPADEYAAPHTAPPPPNPWQDVFQTQYLAAARRFTRDGVLQEAVTAHYDRPQGGTAYLGAGSLKKRLLTGLSRTVAGGPARPPVRFTYCGQEPADGVSADQPYGATQQALYGALRSVTLTEGGVFTFRYGQVDPGRSARDAVVNAPNAGGKTYGSPRFFFERDTVVATWLASDATTAFVRAYAWHGRWLASDLGTVAVADAPAYEALAVATAEDLFGVYTGGQLRAFHRDATRPGQWIQPAGGFFTPDVARGEPTALVAGSRFLALLGLTSGKLNRYRFDGVAWEADEVVTLDRAGAGALFALAARGGLLWAASAAPGQRRSPLYVDLFELAEDGSAFTRLQLQAARPPDVLGAIGLTPGAGFAVARLLGGGASAGAAGYVMLQRDVDRGDPVRASIVTGTRAVVDPQVVGGTVALGRLVLRFDGTAWTPFDTDSVTYPDLAAVEGFSPGSDVVLRKVRVAGASPGYRYDLLGYAPGRGAWSSPAAVVVSAASGAGANAAPRQRAGREATFAVLNGALYRRGADGAWRQVDGVTVPAQAADSATVQLLDDAWLVHQSGTGTASVKTVVRPLRNGGALAALELPGERMAVAGKPAFLLVGPNAFVSYAGDWGTAGARLTLRRVVGQAVAGAQRVYPLASITADSGYQSTVTGFLYEAASAVGGAGGTTAAYQKVSELAGGVTAEAAAAGPLVRKFYNGLTPDEAQGLDYPTGEATNAAQHYGAAQGLQYAEEAWSRSSTAAPVASTVTWWRLWVLALGKAGVGTYARAMRRATTRDGVARTLEQSYDARGQLSRSVTDTYDGDGHRILKAVDYLHWPDVYDPQGTSGVNLLAPVVKVAVSSQDVTAGTPAEEQSVEVTPWRSDWGSGPGRWAPFKRFQATRAQAPAFSLWNDLSPYATPDGWRQLSAVLSRSAGGLPTLTTDVDGTPTGTLHDAAGLLPVAICLNARPDQEELSFLGFEPYEDMGPWAWSGGADGTGGSIRGWVLAGDGHTGDACLRVPYSADGSVGPVARFQPGQQQAAFLFGCWAKLKGSGSGQARWTVTVTKAADGTQVGQPLTLEMSPAGAAWSAFQLVIDLPALRAAAGLPAATELAFLLAAGHRIQGAELLLDDLRLSPLASELQAFVYDESRRPVAALDGNGQSQRTVYAPHGEVLARIGRGDRVDAVTVATDSRALTSQGTFLPRFPNTRLTATTAGMSVYEDFRAPRASDWRFSDAARWSLGQGRLSYAGTAPDLGATATFVPQAHTHFTATVEVVSREARTSVALGNGDIFLRWHGPAERWELVRKNANGTLSLLAVNQAIPFNARLTYVVVDGWVMAYAAATQLFAYRFPYPSPVPPEYGKVTLALTGPGAFDELVLLDDPSLKVTTLDGLGRELQTLELEGYQPLGEGTGVYPVRTRGVFLDALGRTSTVRNPAASTLQLASPQASTGPEPSTSLLVGSPDDYLSGPEGLPLTRDQYLAGEDGTIDYLQRVYDDTPLGLVQQVQLPRPTSAAAEDYTLELARSASSALTPGQPGDEVKRYHVESVTRVYAVTANGTRKKVTRRSVTSPDGRELLRQDVDDAGTALTTRYDHDGSGRLVMVRHPNAFTPPGGSDASAWVERYRYTFTGELAQRTTPDAGTTDFLYDRAGRLRFWRDAAGAATSPQTVLYRKYDALGRLREEGALRDPAVTFNGLAAQVDVADYPAAGSWTRRYAYDRDPSNGDALNRVGRLTQVSINNGDEARPDTEASAYDIHGNVTEVVTQVPRFGGGGTYRLGFRYNSRDQRSGITYPEPLPGQTGERFSMGYYYDRLGRLASVGLPVPTGGVVDPNNPPTPPERRFALYGYDGASRLVSEQLNTAADVANPIQRLYAYGDDGALASVSDLYGVDTLDFHEEGGVDGVRYYGGQIAAVRRQPRKSNLWPRPDDGFMVKFAWDAFGRLTRAQSSLDSAFSCDASGYDANGNLLSRTVGSAAQTLSFRVQDGRRVDNRLDRVGASAAAGASIDFEGLPLDARASGAWAWGSSNGGPSGTALTTAQRHSGTQSLRLGGGGAGHHERLRLSTFLDPRGQYTLGGWIKTEPGFAQAAGEAAWYLTALSAEGPLFTRRVAVLAESTEWTAFPAVAIDLPALVRDLGAGSAVNQVVLELRNSKRGATTATGPGLWVDDITLTGTVSGAALAYDGAGRVTAAVDSGLSSVGYDALTGRPSVLGYGTPGPRRSIGLAGSGDRLTETLIGADGTTVLSQALLLRDLDGRPLVIKHREGGTETTLVQVFGLGGVVAFTRDRSWSFVLRDWLGSTQRVLDPTSRVVGSLDYLPFGGPMRWSGQTDLPELFTGQRRDAQTGAYDFRARLYEPSLGRFLAPDEARQYASPYVYAGNDPLGRTDPDGRAAGRAVALLGAAGAAAIGAFVDFVVRPAFRGSWPHRLFTSIFTTERVKALKEWGEDVDERDRGRLTSAIRSFGELLYNFSHQELAAIKQRYPYAYAYHTPIILLTIYRAIRPEIYVDWEGPQKGNAARHFFWMGKAARYGGVELARGLGAAHEEGRPGAGRLGFFDGLADKINNALAWNYADARKDELRTIFNQLWKDRLLALNAEGTAIAEEGSTEEARAQAEAELIESYRRGLEHLKQVFPHDTPDFNDEEREYLRKHLGWAAGA